MVEVSIIIPFLNEEDSIPMVIEALSKQTEKPHEVIFVDAGSTDRSVQQINDGNETHPDLNIKVINAAPAFPGKARNSGVKESKNDYIAFLDCGLVPSPEWLNEVKKEYQSHSKISGVWSSCFYEGKTPLEVLICAYSFGQKSFFKNFLASSLFQKSIFTSGVWFREDLRATEDTIWRNYVMSHFKTTNCETTHVTYTHFPKTLKEYLNKWSLYSEFIAKSNDNLKQEIVYYFFFASLMTSLLISLPAFISLLSLYIAARGLADPIRRSKDFLWFKPFYYLVIIGPVFVFISDLYKLKGFLRGRLFG